MHKAIILLSSFFLPYQVRAELLTLLKIPLEDKTFYRYSVDLKTNCTFNGVDKIHSPIIREDQDQNIVVDKLEYIQKKINLEVDEKFISADRITFTLAGAKNLKFEFYFKDCKIKKLVHYDGKPHAFENIVMKYDDTIEPPILQKLILKDSSGKEVETLSVPQMQGQLQAYELTIGPAVEITTNVRFNNQRKFEKNQPVIKPQPGFLARYGPIFLSKEGMGSLLYSANGLSLLGTALLKGEAYKYTGINERKDGLYLGGILKYNIIELTYYNDFFKKKGHNLKFALTQDFQKNIDWKFKPQIYVQYFDPTYVDYYYGVSAAESVTSGLPAFKGKGALNYATMLETHYFIKRWTIVGGFGAKFYGKEVYTSPTVVKTYEIRSFFGILYKIF
jgi:hypothetical protein